MLLTNSLTLTNGLTPAVATTQKSVSGQQLSGDMSGFMQLLNTELLAEGEQQLSLLAQIPELQTEQSLPLNGNVLPLPVVQSQGQQQLLATKLINAAGKDELAGQSSLTAQLAQLLNTQKANPAPIQADIVSTNTLTTHLSEHANSILPVKDNLAEFKTAVLDKLNIEIASQFTKNSTQAVTTAKPETAINNLTPEVVTDRLTIFANIERPATQMVQLSVSEPVQSPQWGNAVANKIMWMANQNIQAAQLHLNPPELGPMEIRVMVKGDETSIVFNAHHQMTREVLEQAIPRLREMLDSQGLNLTDVNVDSHRAGQQQGDMNEQANNDTQHQQFSLEDEPDDLLSGELNPATVLGRGLIDTFA